MPVHTVSEVTRYIKALFDGDPVLTDLWVEGEISNFSRASSGHCYFTLKDAESELRCAMWRPLVSRLTWQPAQGDRVEAHGYVSVYERGGVYQFYVDALERGGVGALWREFELLKARLQAEGLFAAERKRALPPWPRRVGVVTSPTGAVFQDILNVLRARYPLVEVVLSPSLVQGQEAPEALVRAIARLNALPDIDVLIMARGGGSLEDLWAFNDERVARAIASSRIPVVSGVGHETDFTIADFVADVRAPTPSAAAAAIVPDIRDVRARVEALTQDLRQYVTERLRLGRERLQQAARALRLHVPQRILAEQAQRVDDLVHRASTTWEHQMALRRAQLGGYRARLGALHPLRVLERGYAIIQDRLSGQTIVSVQQATPRQRVILHVYDGRLGAKITEVLGRMSQAGGGIA